MVYSQMTEDIIVGEHDVGIPVLQRMINNNV